jgi:hypothetical protein
MKKMTMLLFACLAATGLGACTDGGIPVNVDTPCLGQEGDHGQAFFCGGGNDLNVRVGAEQDVAVFTPDSSRADIQIHRVTSSDPSIATVDMQECSYGSCPNWFDVTGVQPGKFVATIYDANNVELDEVTVNVLPPQ